ncbi:class I SAM-dependent methyltransferase [Cohnella boryungensis]|uniref:Class I SAM-dependent methyltransferase n=1 Tax=Cohnella boryungensis TaxID=768479 RepID=A0ABV8SEB3_9BACL
MNPLEYKAFYEQVGKINGWDFSSVKCVSEGNTRDLYREVTKVCTPSDLWLDIGAGDGEAILPLAESALLLVGVDQSFGMIETAARYAAESGIPNVRFMRMEATSLRFPEGFFNVVSCRHSEFCAKEVAKVLMKGGTFLTQQVSENDKSNLKQAFGRGQTWGAKTGTLQQHYLAELGKAGFSDIQTFEFKFIEYYQTAEDLIFLLKHTYPRRRGLRQFRNAFS